MCREPLCTEYKRLCNILHPQLITKCCSSIKRKVTDGIITASSPLTTRASTTGFRIATHIHTWCTTLLQVTNQTSHYICIASLTILRFTNIGQSITNYDVILQCTTCVSGSRSSICCGSCSCCSICCTNGGQCSLLHDNDISIQHIKHLDGISAVDGKLCNVATSTVDALVGSCQDQQGLLVCGAAAAAAAVHRHQARM